MKMIFHCKDCDFDFEVESPSKKEYTDPVFGACFKYIAFCPQCNAECSEKPRRKPPKKEQSSKPLFGQNNCGPGAGCCG